MNEREPEEISELMARAAGELRPEGGARALGRLDRMRVPRARRSCGSR